MALGGGTFVSQNKVLPGAYINVISVSASSAALGDRGIAAMALDLDWGKDNAIFELTRADFQSKSKELLGYDFGHEKMKGLRDLFLNTSSLIAYKLTSGGQKAENGLAVAIHGGVRGNDLQVRIEEVMDSDDVKVITLLDNQPVDEQVVASNADLVANAYVEFKEGAPITPTAGTPLTGGTNGSVDGGAHQAFLDKAEAHQFNAIAVATTDEAINNLYATFTERMRDERGSKFQAVLYNTAANYEGVVNVKNDVTDDDNVASLVYWVAGVVAGKPVNESALNDIYDGEFEVDVDYTQTELEQAIAAGEFTLHQVGFDVRVLMDINSLVSTTATKGDVFKENQTIRIIDQKANDIASLFAEKYLGAVPNDQSGRVSLQSDIDGLNQQLLDIRALESFESATVEQGNDKKSVVVNDATVIVNTMEKLYMTTVVA